jgi:hypothetical protein
MRFKLLVIEKEGSPVAAPKRVAGNIVVPHCHYQSGNAAWLAGGNKQALAYLPGISR